MLRLVELLLFLTPFAVFIVWRIVAKGGGPSYRLVVGAACFLLVLAALLIWFRNYESLAPNAAYAPATFEDGHIVSGHSVPR